MNPPFGSRRLLVRAAGALVAALVLTATVRAAEPLEGPRLVRDLRTGVRVHDRLTSLEVGGVVSLGSVAVFSGFSLEGLECGLWSTDGTPEGTRHLTDLCANAPADNPGAFGSAGLLAAGAGIGYAVDTSGRLWRTDGSRAGTFPLGEVRLEMHRWQSVLAGDRRTLYFAGCTAESGCELWVTDGSETGTRQVRDLLFGPDSSHPNAFSSSDRRAYFIASEAGGSEPALWETDGTSEGTRRLVAPLTATHTLVQGSTVVLVSPGCQHWFCDGSAVAFDPSSGKRATLAQVSGGTLQLQRAAGTLWIETRNADSDEQRLWRSDGSVRGTVEVGLPPGFRTLGLAPRAAGRRVLIAGAVGPGAERLWVLTGDRPRAVPLPGGPELPNGFVLPGWPSTAAVGGRLLFAGRDDEHGVEVWVTDGTPAGTALLRDLCAGPCDGIPSGFLTLLGRALWIDAEGYLWTSDATAAGTRRLAQTALPGNPRYYPIDAAAFRDRVLFAGYDAVRGPQLWGSDLTPRGTRPVTLLGSLAANSWIWGPVPVGQRVVFAACDDTSADLWASDGTAAGTIGLTGSPASCDLRPTPQVAVAGGLAYSVWQDQLWASDGTPVGTVPVASGIASWRGAAEVDGRLLFVLDPESFTLPSNWRVWVSDGTAAGTGPLFDLPLGGSPMWFSAAGGLAFFVAQAPAPSFALTLFRTDGTASGTLPLLALESEGFGLRVLPLGSGAFFLARAAGQPDVELFRTDGTAAGTVPIFTDGGGAVRPREPLFLSACGSALCFFARTAAGSPAALWRSDGTAAGTVPLAEVSPPLGDFGPIDPHLTDAGALTFFRGQSPRHGVELWRTDGTPEGTLRLTDLVPGPGHARIGELAEHQGRLLFAATGGHQGVELWASDGTAAGTALVEDLAPGAVSSVPAQFVRAGGNLFFTADDGLTGRELWLLPAGSATSWCSGPRTVCLMGGRVRAMAAWRDGDAWRPAAGAALDPWSGFFTFRGLPAAGGQPDVAFRLAVNRNGTPGAVFVGGLSHLEFVVTLTDLESGVSRRYVNVAGNLGSLYDRVGLRRPAAPAVHLLRLPAGRAEGKLATAAGAGQECVPVPGRLCLLGGRFAVELSGRAPGSGPEPGAGVALSERSGAFLLSAPRRTALVVKLVDGAAVNGHVWLFAAALEKAEMVLTVTDTAAGEVRSYLFPAGSPASLGDTEAF